MPPLKNHRQEIFCLEYVKDGDKLRAYKAAGYEPVSTNSWASCSSQLLNKTYVKKRLAELQARIATRVEVSAARVINELGRIAFSDPRKALGRDGAIMDPKDWDDDMAGAVAGLEVEKLFEGSGNQKIFIGYTQKLKLWDKNTALTNLAKHFKLLLDETPKPGDTYNTQIIFTMPVNARDPLEVVTHGSNGHTNGSGNGSGT